MHKFLSFVSLSALAFCLNGHQAYGMFEEDEENASSYSYCILDSYKRVSDAICDEDLRHMPKLKHLKFHTIQPSFKCDWGTYTLPPVKVMATLKSLTVRNNITITGCTLINHPYLTELDLTGAPAFEDDSLKTLTNLTSLALIEHAKITGRTLTNHPHLTALDLSGSLAFEEESLLNLTSLTSLDLMGPTTITGRTLTKHPHLTLLNLHENEGFKEEYLQNLTNLTSLDLGYNMNISSKALYSLPKCCEVKGRKGGLITPEQYQTWEIYKRVGPQVQLLMMMGLNKF